MNIIPIEQELDHVERWKDREKMEQKDKDAMIMIQKERNKTEWERKGTLGFKEKRQNMALSCVGI